MGPEAPPEPALWVMAQAESDPARVARVLAPAVQALAAPALAETAQAQAA